MENTPIEAAGAAPVAQTEATPITQPTAPAVDMHGFTSEQLADMRRFYDANGGYDKVKSRISNPAPAQPAQPVQPTQPAQPVQPMNMRPIPLDGTMSQEEFVTQQYFEALAREERYAPIAKDIRTGAILKDMAELDIHPLDASGRFNDDRIHKFLNLKAQTVAATQTSMAPEASAAPTVDYIPVGENITDLNQAYDILRQDAQLKSTGQAGHPAIAKAEEFIKNSYTNK